MHAAGVIMSSEPLLDIIPIMRREQDGAIITQFDYPTCETLGLIKMDFLGLRNLTVLDDALEQHRGQPRRDGRPRGPRRSTTRRPTSCSARGDTLGVFQLDGGPMRALLRSMRPDNFEDISAVGALYRPGPMGAELAQQVRPTARTAASRSTPIHPELAEPLAEILGETYGLIVYQEQVMAIAQKLAGYSLGQADLLRRAMGKKKKEILDKRVRAASPAGMTERRLLRRRRSRRCGTSCVPFSDYAFNKAHTAAYGLVSYWTAYLKANYPAEYMAALLTSVKDDKDKMAIYLNECRRMGIQVLPPDVNESDGQLHPGRHRHPLRPDRDPQRRRQRRRRDRRGPRASKGRFTDFDDFLDKVAAAGLQQAGRSSR